MPDVAGRRHTMPYRAGVSTRCHINQVAAVTGSIDQRQPINLMFNDTRYACSRHANSGTNTSPLPQSRGANRAE